MLNTTENTNLNAEQEQSTPGDIGHFFVELTHNEGKPIYLVDTVYPELVYAGAAVYDIETINKDIKQHPGFNTQRQGANISPVIILFDDANKAAKKKANNIYSVLKGAGIAVFRQSANRPFKAVTCAGAENVARELAEQYAANFSAAGTIQDFKNVINSTANTPAIKTGFEMLDEELDGGLYEGLYAIGAISSLGKTTFCLNIAEQIAAGGHDVIIIALEMSKYSLIGRSISRQTFIKYRQEPGAYSYNDCKTSRGITDGSRYTNYSNNERQLINEAITNYTEQAGKHLFIHEAIGNMTAEKIRDIVNEHIAYTGQTPVLIVDYLQLIQSADKYINGNDKIRTDFNLTELKQLSRDYKLPIIVISSFNRASYNTEAKQECFKESGGIDYTCDVIIGLQLAGVGGPDFDVNEAKAKDPREVELVFLKNREAAVGGMIKYYYFPKFNHFEESRENVRAEREYKKELAEEQKRAAKQNRAEQLAAEHAAIIRQAFDACEENGAALITDMVEFCGGKPTEKTLTQYIKAAPGYNIIGNRVTRK